MVTSSRIDLNARHVRSLAWHGDAAIDLLAGGTVYHLDGTISEPETPRVHAFPFDSVIGNDRLAILHERYGTKGLLVHVDDGKEVREINRHYYYARDYAYPVTVLTLPDGQDAIVHCPREYCSLDIEVATTGECLTRREYHSDDIFHSNLHVTGDGRFLVENAWVWQPWNVVLAYDLQRALEDPAHLDGAGIRVPQGGSTGWEPRNVTTCGHVVVTASVHDGPEDPEKEAEFDVLPAEPGVEETSPVHPDRVRQVRASELSIIDQAGNPIDLGSTNKRPEGYHYLLQAFDLDSGRITSSRLMPEPPGRMMAVGPRHVVSFYDHPKLIEVATGKVLARWEDLHAGPEQEQPSAMMKPPGLPVLACDPDRRRFAIGMQARVILIQLSGID